MEISNYVNVKLVDNNSKLPTRGTVGSVGYDLYSSENCILPGNGKGLVSTGISIDIKYESIFPNETLYARIAPRSGLSWKNHIDIGAGVIDMDYRGIIKVVMFNHDMNDYKVNIGDRIAQLIFERAFIPNELKLVSTLDSSERESSGFGSTGK